jgi:GPH family glycoside/pentoside/hexuronide:cation symporter
MLADLIGPDRPARDSGAYFGVWTLTTKLNLALAAGIALPLVAALGFDPAAGSPEGTRALAIVYALVPCVLKLGAAALLWRIRRP